MNAPEEPDLPVDLLGIFCVGKRREGLSALVAALFGFGFWAFGGLGLSAEQLLLEPHQLGFQRLALHSASMLRPPIVCLLAQFNQGGIEARILRVHTPIIQRRGLRVQTLFRNPRGLCVEQTGTGLPKAYPKNLSREFYNTKQYGRLRSLTQKCKARQGRFLLRSILCGFA